MYANPKREQQQMFEHQQAMQAHFMAHLAAANSATTASTAAASFKFVEEEEVASEQTRIKLQNAKDKFADISKKRETNKVKATISKNDAKKVAAEAALKDAKAGAGNLPAPKAT